MSDNKLNQDPNQNAGSNSETGHDRSMQTAGATQDKDAQRKGGQHSHSGSNRASGSDDSDDESDRSRSASDQQPDEESSSDRSRSSNQPRGAAVDKDAQRKGGQHSHGGR